MRAELINAKTAAEEIGVNEQFLRKLAREGKIPSYKLSRRTLRFDLDELKAWMKRYAENQSGKAA